MNLRALPKCPILHAIAIDCDYQRHVHTGLCRYSVSLYTLFKVVREVLVCVYYAKWSDMGPQKKWEETANTNNYE